MPALRPGIIALLGSGETAPAGGVVYDTLARELPPPLKIALLETPAGFQPNSAQVAGKVADFLRTRLQNYRPQIATVPARRRGTPSSPDEPAISLPLCDAGMIFLGPGSPTYAVSQLRGSLAYQRLVARQRVGAAIVTASAATIALGAYALPVYEIYKVGADLHWQPGLDFFGAYGLTLVFVPHWNNAEGGAELDTSRCFMGQERFEQLVALLPPKAVVVGIDEHSALLIDLASARCSVMGRGGVTVLRGSTEQTFPRGAQFALDAFGAVRQIDPASGVPAAVWREVQPADAGTTPEEAPEAVMALVAARQEARAQRDWGGADAIRAQLAALGWEVRDTPGGAVVQPLAP
jgi:hypothetical protein